MRKAYLDFLLFVTIGAGSGAILLLAGIGVYLIHLHGGIR